MPTPRPFTKPVAPSSRAPTTGETTSIAAPAATPSVTCMAPRMSPSPRWRGPLFSPLKKTSSLDGISSASCLSSSLVFGGSSAATGADAAGVVLSSAISTLRHALIPNAPVPTLDKKPLDTGFWLQFQARTRSLVRTAPSDRGNAGFPEG
eukprot:scaffold733_cov267-Pinguiococcus_pyrenoidosus.AAC.17